MNKGFFMHRRFGHQPKGGVTAYFEIKEVQPTRYEVAYSVARCNPIDNFTRRTGRTIALGRFQKRRRFEDVMTYLVEAPDSDKARELVVRRMDAICNAELEAIEDLHQLRIGGLVRKYEHLIRTGRVTQ